MKMKWLPSDTITVLYNSGHNGERSPTTLSFSDDYVKALRGAFDAVKAGMDNVRVMQYREILHTHQQLVSAMDNLTLYPTDEEILEQIHHSSRSAEHSGLMHLLRSATHNSPVVWASF